jgi:vacuolar-type H+-ATPase subunit F/Vma7
MKATVKTIRVERPGIEDKSLVGKDISETELDGYNFDYIIINNKDIESLQKRVDKMLSEIDVPDVFLISGKKRSGKDTVSQMIADSLGYKVVHFADELKNDIIEFNKSNHIIPKEYLDEDGRFLDDFKEAEILQDCPMAHNDTRSTQICESFAHAKDKYGKVTYRNLLIQYGCDMRDINKDYWVQRLIGKEDANGIIISDWRFINEHKFFME